MSKRDESIIQFVEQYKELGYLPEALVNFLVLLGWSPEGEEEIFNKEELIQRFTLERVSKSPAVFDVDKLNWMNNHYIKQKSVDELASLSIPHLQKAGLLPEQLSPEQENWAKEVVALYQEQMAYGAQIVELAALFFADGLEYNEGEKEVLAEEQVPEVLKAFYNEISDLADYTPEAIKASLKIVQKSTGYKGKKLFMPVRVAATGSIHGPDIARTLFLLGKEKVLQRIENVMQ